VISCLIKFNDYYSVVAEYFIGKVKIPSNHINSVSFLNLSAFFDSTIQHVFIVGRPVASFSSGADSLILFTGRV
jgi:hypothetical protein